MNRNGDTDRLTAEEENMQRLLNETSKQIAELEDQIKQLPKDKVTSLDLRFPGMPSTNANGRWAQQKYALNSKVYELETGIEQKANEIGNQSDTETQKKIQEKLNKWKESRQQEKSFNFLEEQKLLINQDKAMQILDDYKKAKKSNAPVNTESKPKEVEATPIPASGEQSLTKSYSMQFTYFHKDDGAYKAAEKKDIPLNTGINLDNI